MKTFVPYVVAAAFIAGQVQADPVIKLDTGKLFAEITLASSATGITTSEFGMLRVENQITGDLIFAELENQRDVPLYLDSSYAKGPNPHRIFELA